MDRILIITPAMSGHGGTESVLSKVISHNPNGYFLFVISTENKSWLRQTKLDNSCIYKNYNPDFCKRNSYYPLSVD